MKTYLEREGYEVVWGKDERDGLNKFKESTYSMVILDVVFPKLGGWAVFREIRLIRAERKTVQAPVLGLPLQKRS